MTDLDIIGTLYRTQTDPETPPEPLTGWHVNTTEAGLIANPDLVAFVITPSRLRRVWAGDDPVDPDLTVTLRFDSEAQARAVLGLE